MAEMQLNGHLNAKEIEHHSTDPFLNEKAGHFLEGGRIRRDAYKGSTREDREKVRDSLVVQAAEQQADRHANMLDEMLFSRESEKTRKNLVAMEREKYRMRRAALEKVASENKQVEMHQKANRKAVEEGYKNKIS